jgi:hypothetical protein
MYYDTSLGEELIEILSSVHGDKIYEDISDMYSYRINKNVIEHNSLIYLN